MNIEIPELDVAYGLEICGGDTETYLYSLRLYVTSLPPLLQKMRAASEKTLHEYSINVHNVKSISEYIGAREANRTARQLESMAKEGDLAGLLERNESFIKYLEKLVGDIKSWLAETGNDGE